MFEIGFGELILVAVVALVVLGPERLPRVARVTGIILGRCYRHAIKFKTELANELHQIDIDKKNPPHE